MIPKDDTARCAPVPGEATAIALLLLGAVCISFSPVFVKIAQVGPSTSAFYRMAFGGLGLVAAVLFHKGVTRGARRDARGPARGRGVSGLAAWFGLAALPLAAWCALAFALDLAFWHAAIHIVGPGLATILANSQVVLLAAYGVLVLGECGVARLAVSLLFAAAGIGLLFGPDWAAAPEASLTGLLYGLSAAVCYAVFLVGLRRLQTDQDFAAKLRNMAALSLITALMLAPLAHLDGSGFVIPDGVSLGALMAYGLLGQGVGWMLIAANLPRVALSTAGLAILLQPTLAFVWDVLFFGRRAEMTDVAGGALAVRAICGGPTTHARARS